jgi:hypothetical protein
MEPNIKDNCQAELKNLVFLLQRYVIQQMLPILLPHWEEYFSRHFSFTTNIPYSNSLICHQNYIV